MNIESLQSKIETSTTRAQIEKMLTSNNVSFEYSSETGSFYVGVYRIYKPYKSKTYLLQKRQKVTFEMSDAGKAFFNSPDYLKNSL